MNLPRIVRSRLGLKFLLSYLIVIAVGVAVLGSAAGLTVPASFDRHLAAMESMMGGAGMGTGMDLFSGYRAAVAESLLWAASAAIAAAVVVSLFVSRRVVEPVRQMMSASRRIAEGHYAERLALNDRSPEDMDELEQLAVSLNRMASRLEQTEAVRRQLMADVAHEFRTPLSVMSGSLEALIDGVLPADQDNLIRLHQEAGRLQRLVGDLQELSRVEAGAFELELRRVDPVRLIRTAVDRLGRQFEEKGVELVVETAGGLPPVLADEGRTGQVLLNVLGNALQYTPTGRKVSVGARARAEQVEIEVVDQGIGISPENLPHIFTRFYRVDRSRSRAGGGSGIGLTIARHLAEAQRGSLQAESAGTGKGTRFVLRLPRSRESGAFTGTSSDQQALDTTQV